LTYEIVWELPALAAASRFLKSDPSGLGRLMEAVDRLAEDPRPAGTHAYGHPDLRRLRVGAYRVIYELNASSGVIKVFHIGRVTEP
jgi:mRNA interferase RelE/StbE